MLSRCISTVDSCPATDLSLSRGRFSVYVEQKLFAKTLVCSFHVNHTQTHTAVMESYCEAECYGIFRFYFEGTVRLCVAV